MATKKELEDTAWYLTYSVGEQLSRVSLTYLKKATLKTMVGELIAGIIKDGRDLHPRFDTDHMRVYKANKKKIATMVASQLV